MAGISATLSKEDLQFMAEDIGRELMAFLPPKERLAGISVDELLKAIDSGILLRELNPDHRKVLLELLVTMQAASLRDKKKRNGNS
jgi:hypothetical protein